LLHQNGSEVRVRQLRSKAAAHRQSQSASCTSNPSPHPIRRPRSQPATTLLSTPSGSVASSSLLGSTSENHQSSDGRTLSASAWQWGELALPRTLSLESTRFAPVATPPLRCKLGTRGLHHMAGDGGGTRKAAHQSEAAEAVATALLPYACLVNVGLDDQDVDPKMLPLEGPVPRFTTAPLPTPAPRRTQMAYREDLFGVVAWSPSGQHGGAQLRLSQLHRVGGHRIRAPGPQGAATPSEFVSSLRAPLAEHMPFLPRPAVSEAGRSGAFSTHVESTTTREKYVAFRKRGPEDTGTDAGPCAPLAVEERVKAARERLAQKLAVWGEPGPSERPASSKRLRRKGSSKHSVARKS
jgi:hypothetical protein